MDLQGHPNVNRNIYRNKAKHEIGGIRDTRQDDIDRKNNFKKKHRRKFLKGQNIWWWNPPMYSSVAEFCSDTSIHGFKFMAQRNRHISERIFWMISFGIGIAAAALLINSVWTRYQENPVIVTFMPTDQNINTLPFPAVTICNMNKFPKSKIEQLLGQMKTNSSEKQLQFADVICNIQRSFSKLLNYSYSRGTINSKLDAINAEERRDLMRFIYNQTLQCDELLRLCVWDHNPYDCSDLFKGSATNYGKCCTFNALPSNLLYRRKVSLKRWTDEEIKDWGKLKVQDKWVLLEKGLKYPRRQMHAGMPYGLSVLIDPQTDEYFCPISDSEGIKYLVHNPLEIAHVHEFGSAVGVGREVFVEVQPDVTLADEEIDEFPPEKRLCIFGYERQLQGFKPYTINNCIDECIAQYYSDTCGCIMLYQPPIKGVKRICAEDDFPCVQTTNVKILVDIAASCPLCEQLCEDVKYNYDTTWAVLQNSSDLWKSHKNGSVVPWADHRMSIVHIYYGAQTVVPKLRKKLFGAVDLIANVGGILGLCLGISILSAVEAVYFFTIRMFWKRIRRMTLGYRVANIFWLAYNKYKLQKSSKKKHYVYGTNKIKDKISLIDLEGPYNANVKLPSVYEDDYGSDKKRKQHNS